MNFIYAGTNSYFLAEAFFNNAGSLVDAEVTSPRNVVTTQVEVTNFQTGFVTVITGTNLLVNSQGDPTQGTITGMAFFQNGVLQGSISDISWSFTGLVDALLDIEDANDFAALAALFSSSGAINVDASFANAGFDQAGLFGPFADLLTQPIIVQTGSDNSDTFLGTPGNDTIDPGANYFGEDLIFGTLGNDQIRLLNGTPESFYFLEYSGIGGPINVFLNGAANTGSIDGPGFVDLIENPAAGTLADGLGIAGTPFDDSFTANPGNGGFLLLRGNEGNDTFNLTLDGTVRLGYRYGTTGAPTSGIVVNLATGVVSNDGFGFTDTINVTGGSGGRLEIRGTDLADSIIGSDNNDSFIPEQGNDTFDGGLGFDRVRYDRSGVSQVNVNLQTNTATGQWDGNYFTDTLIDVEYIRGSREGNDTIRGDGDDELFIGRGGDDYLEGNGGNDELDGEDGNDTMSGGAGDDTLFGGDGNDLGFSGAGADLLEGGNGNDTLYGAGDNDTLFGENGDDLLGGGGGSDSLVGGEGNDALWTAAGDDTAHGEGGNDSLGGGQGDDSLVGGDGEDELWGSFGNDTLEGGNDDDLLGGFDGNDSLEGGNGNDEIWGAAGNDTAKGGDGDDQIGGGTDNDSIEGNLGNDSLFGGLGDDTVLGGFGDDLIYGAAGNDSLDGGGGNDTIFAGPGADTVVYGDGADELQFFSLSEDRLELDQTLWGGGLTEAQVVSTYGSQVGSDFVLDFGGGDTVTLVGAGAAAGLDGQIDFF